jgi:hypothetical protein
MEVFRSSRSVFLCVAADALQIAREKVLPSGELSPAVSGRAETIAWSARRVLDVVAARWEGPGVTAVLPLLDVLQPTLAFLGILADRIAAISGGTPVYPGAAEWAACIASGRAGPDQVGQEGGAA